MGWFSPARTVVYGETGALRIDTSPLVILLLGATNRLRSECFGLFHQP